MMILSFYRKKNVKNYLIIIVSLIFLLTFLITLKDFFTNLINSNYSRSFIYIKINSNQELEILKNNSNISIINKCIYLSDTYIVENKDLINGVIYASNLENIENTDFQVLISNTLQPNVYMLSMLDFSNYSYDNGYYITLKNWLNLNSTIDYLYSKNINIDPHIYKNNNIEIENVLKYLDLVIIILIIISIITYIFTIINLIIDEQKKNKIYKYLGYSSKDIFKFNCYKFLSLIFFSVIINELLHLLLIFIFKSFHIKNLYIYLIMLVITIILLLLNRIFERR